MPPVTDAANGMLVLAIYAGIGLFFLGLIELIFEDPMNTQRWQFVNALAIVILMTIAIINTFGWYTLILIPWIVWTSIPTTDRPRFADIRKLWK